MTLDYLNEYEYGIWLTLSSILSWIYLMDIGLGNGLRNKLTEALANKNLELGRIYVSTAFFYLTAIILTFYVIFILSQTFIDWYSILNVEQDKVSNLNSIVTIVVGIVCVNFLFKMVGNIYMAHQLPAVNDFMVLLGNIMSLAIIFILTKTTSGSLIDVAITFSAAPALVYMIAFPITFRIFKKIRPSIKYVRKKYFSDLITLGANFLIIQIAALVIFMTSNVIISHLFGPAEVTPYNIAYKYFSITITVFSLILNPFWSAITDAKEKNDYEWIKRIFRKLLFSWLILDVAIIVMVFIAPIFYKVWIGDDVGIPKGMTILCALYVIFYNIGNLLAFVINGFGTLRIATFFSIFQAACYIPMAIYFGKNFGVSGILIALCITTILNLTWAPYQCFLLINNRAAGIWRL